MINILFNKKYLIYGGSVVVSRGLEFLILFYAAYVLNKETYGNLEYYKKIIEVCSIGFAFGFPTLLMSYTKGDKNKDYFFMLSTICVLLLGVVSLAVSFFFDWKFLVLPFIFYALFFTGGITQSYLLVKHGSNVASLYKIIISILFYGLAFLTIYYFKVNEYAFVYANYFLFPILLLYIVYISFKQNIKLGLLKKYYRLFKKLLLGSFTMVISDFANMLFLYTDIFVIKILSDNVGVEIANFSFALNIAAIILIIPTTILQVNIEKLKSKNSEVLNFINKQITVVILFVSIFLVVFYKMFVDYFYIDYKETFSLFLLIVVAKIFQCLSNLYGTNLLILKRYKTNLLLNILFLALNIFLCFALYSLLGLYGIALSSILCLMTRYMILVKINNDVIAKEW